MGRSLVGVFEFVSWEASWPTVAEFQTLVFRRMRPHEGSLRMPAPRMTAASLSTILDCPLERSRCSVSWEKGQLLGWFMCLAFGIELYQHKHVCWLSRDHRFQVSATAVCLQHLCNAHVQVAVKGRTRWYIIGSRMVGRHIVSSEGLCARPPTLVTQQC